METEVKIKKNKTSPLLRFPEFEKEWKIERLGNLCSTFKSGSNITAVNIFETGEYPVYGGNGLRGYTNSFTHEGTFVLIGRQGALCGNINKVSGKIFISEHAIAVQGDDSSDTEWLAQKLDYFNLNRLSESSAQPGLAVGKLVRLKINIPSFPEQQKIASFLSAVDKKIQQLIRKKDLLESYKKGVMQQLFMREIRFKQDDGKAFPEWEKKNYGDIYNFLSTNSFSRNDLNYEAGTVKNIHYGDIHTKFPNLFHLSKEMVPFINNDKDLSKINSENYCREGDLVIADASEDYKDIGKSIEIIDLNGEKVLAGLHTFLARPNPDLMYKGFSGYLVQTWKFRKQVMTIAQGTKVLGLSTSRMKKLKVEIPSLKEQQKIANFLSGIDKKIEAVSQQITQTQSFKKGLLQQMFV